VAGGHRPGGYRGVLVYPAPNHPWGAYAVGGNMQAARLTGIKVWLVLLFVYGMSGLLSGLGGVMSAAAVQRQR
jgi:predicted ABC-type sugar transport system permease subunit